MTLLVWLMAGAVVAACLLGCLRQSVLAAARAAVEEHGAKRGKPHATRRAQQVLDDAAGHARAVGLLGLLSNLTATVIAVRLVADLRGAEQVGAADAAIGVLGAGAVLWVVAVALPMSIARYAAARVVHAWSLPLRLVGWALLPLRTLSAAMDESVRRVLGVEERELGEQVQAELLSVIEEGQATGALGEEEREMIEAVVEFRDLTVQQVMTPRTEIESMPYSDDLGEVTRAIREIGHSRIPVYEESLDHIVGIFYVKDLMRWLAGDGVRGGGKPFDLRAILRPAIFVPETKTVRELLSELIQKNVHIAMVADEYGGTSGLVTIEDIVEEVFGDIRDEYEAATQENPDVVLRAGEKAADLDAAARISDANAGIEALGVQLPESEEYDTVGGFVVTTLGRIPAAGESFRHEGMTITVLEAKPTKVVKVGVKVEEDAVSDPAAPADSAATEPLAVGAAAAGPLPANILAAGPLAAGPLAAGPPGAAPKPLNGRGPNGPGHAEGPAVSGAKARAPGER